MDLKHDWKALNEVLFHGTSWGSGLAVTGAAPGLEAGGSSLVLLEDDDRVIDGVASNGRAFTDTAITGVSSSKDILDELAGKYGTEQTIVLSKKVLDQCVIEAATLGTNYFQQLQSLRSKVLDQIGRKKGGLIVSRRNFLLDLFGMKLKRVLPRRFNVLLFIDQRAPTSHTEGFSFRSILLSYSGGQLDQFFEPDFSSLHENRLKNWNQESDAIGQYLNSRYILPCYGIFMHKEEWERCLEVASIKGRPWGQFVRYYDGGSAAVYPNRIIAKILLGIQRIMVYFGRL
ncbi:MAG: hypothetical protein HY074_02950 [Deltaproteobacteria bacterium]|nr:hypothetical protein [Deltaproteobacteria bacterium]